MMNGARFIVERDPTRARRARPWHAGPPARCRFKGGARWARPMPAGRSVLKLPDPRAELLNRHTGVRHSFVAVGEHAADDAFAGAADEDGWVWLLRRLGPGPDGVEVDVAAVVLGLVVGPDLAHRLHALVHDRPAGRWVDAVVGNLLWDPAGADAEQHASVREEVEAGDRLRRRDRLPLGHQAHAGPEPQRLRRGGGVGHGDERVV